MEKMICGMCKEEITGVAVLSPTLEEEHRCMCPDCAMKELEQQHPEMMKKINEYLKEEPEFKCKKIMVPEDVCYVAFFNERKKWQTYQEELGVTPRNEMVIADYNEKHELIGIELLGDKKPCQAFSEALKGDKCGKG